MTDNYSNEQFNGEGAGPSKGLIIGLGVLAVLFVAALVAAVYFLLQPGAPTETIRDIVIILVAFEFMVIGLALVILLIQLAQLLNLLQNEVRPIIDSASEAANTLRGTARFLSENLVEPVVKVNAGLAAARRALDMLTPGRRK
ncbi:MAG TPA: hypothetical protein PLC52_00070 [Anaerolineales bacterium]|nr:hypothetical protein [Anaerolineales bacterium]HRQ91249.1 hypothetical protein [Anaerolineales bacterium]